MAGEIILIDTSILIYFFRKSDKDNSKLLSLVKKGYRFCISAITEYEVYCGANEAQYRYWEDFLLKTEVLPFDKEVVKAAVEINSELKRSRNQVDIADLFIAATAVAHKLSFTTLNIKHFERIDRLQLIHF